MDFQPIANDVLIASEIPNNTGNVMHLGANRAINDCGICFCGVLRKLYVGSLLCPCYGLFPSINK